MTREALYHKSCNILYNAYLNRTLSHSFCTSCAIGNLVAANCGYQMVKTKEDDDCPLIVNGYRLTSFNWLKPNGEVVRDMDAEWWNVFRLGKIMDYTHIPGLLEIKSTGYSVFECVRIEYAFECADRGSSEDEWLFNGLIAVIKVINSIHEVDSNEQLKRFEEVYNTVEAIS